MFWKVEGRTGLYVLFKTVCDIYGLIPEDNYTIPPEAEGIEPPSESMSSMPPLILKREPLSSGPQDKEGSAIIEGLSENALSTVGTTKRHRHSPSVGATSVTTVVEEAEEEEDQLTKGSSRPLTQIFDLTPEEAGEVEAGQPEETTEAKDEHVPTEETAPQDSRSTDETEEANTESKYKADSEHEPESGTESEAKREGSTTERPVTAEESTTSESLAQVSEEHQITNDENEMPTESVQTSEKKGSATESGAEKESTASEPVIEADKTDELKAKKADA